MVKKINIEKAVEFIKSEYSDIYDTMIFMAFDNGRPEEEVELEVNSIDNGLKNHEQVFLNMGLMYHDPDASGYEGIVMDAMFQDHMVMVWVATNIITLKMQRTGMKLKLL